MSDIRKTAERLCREYGTNDPFELCGALGIAVLYCDLPAEIKGFYLQIEGGKVVFLNELLEEPAARVICGHELGHALLHDDYNAVYLRTQTLMNCQRYENEADLFCACLLLQNAAPEGDGEVITVQDLSRRTGLPERVVRLHWQESGRI